MLGRIFKAIIELNNRDQIANPLTLDHYFTDDEAFNEIGGKKYLLSLWRNIGSSIVRDYAKLVELYNKGTNKNYEIYFKLPKLDYDKNSLDLIEETESKLYLLTENEKSENNKLISFSGL